MTKPETMMIDDVKYVREDAVKKMEPADSEGKEYCIVRTYSAGVFAGWLDRKGTRREGTVYGARRIYYWKGAASLSQLANDGTNSPSECKFPAAVAEVDLKEIIEVLPCSTLAMNSIEGVPEWSA
jgi:hypothetical protein